MESRLRDVAQHMMDKCLTVSYWRSQRGRRKGLRLTFRGHLRNLHGLRIFRAAGQRRVCATGRLESASAAGQIEVSDASVS
jgi:hypothetical protein